MVDRQVYAYAWVGELSMVKLYQNIPLNGVEHQNTNRVGSKFWNEGKWDNFIAPLLRKDCTDRTFVEMGCNAGLFLKLAEDKGFRHVVGVEKDKTPVEEGLRYRNLIGYNYRIIKRTLGGPFGNPGNFNIDEIPVADITLMSTFHYYIDINSWIKYLDRLRNKTHHVLIVSRHVSQDHWRALSDYKSVCKYFEGWEELGVIKGISKDNDPSPRNLWSMIFRNPLLARINIEDIKTPKTEMCVAIGNLAALVRDNDNIDPFDTDYYKAWVERKRGRWSSKKIRMFVKDKFDLMISIKENGLIDPLIVQQDNKLSDGGHRLAVLKAFGYKSVLVRRT